MKKMVLFLFILTGAFMFYSCSLIQKAKPAEQKVVGCICECIEACMCEADCICKCNAE